MWSKFSNVLKRGEGEPSSLSLTTDIAQEETKQEEHTELEAGPSTILSPPSSPTRQNKRGLFKRASKIYSEKEANGSSLSLARRVKSSLHLNSTANASNLSLASQSGQDHAPQPMLGSVRSLFNKDRKPSAMQLQAALNKSDDALSKHSVETTRPTSPAPLSAPMPAPQTPTDLYRQYGSVRSILRDRNTPGSGQNVRFFSRDAYRVISPESSMNTSSGDVLEPPTMQSLTAELALNQDSSPLNDDPTKYHSAAASPVAFSPSPGSPNIFMVDGSPAATSTPYTTQGSGQKGSMFMPVPPPQLTGPFDSSVSSEHAVHSIPEDDEINEVGEEAVASPRKVLPRLDTAVPNITNRDSSHSSVSSMSLETPSSFVSEKTTSSEARHQPDVPEIRASEEIQKSILRPSPGHILRKKQKRDSLPATLSAPSIRSRSFSDKVFSRPPVDEMKDSSLMPPFTPTFEQVNHSVPNDIGFQTPGAMEGPDPFRADASNYYNPDAGFPNSPPRLANVRYDSGVSGTSSRSTSGISQHSSLQSTQASPGEEVVLALRTQLAFHQELTSQYELDISMRDEHVKLLNDKVRNYEEDAEKRTKIMRGMRRKVQELERAYRSLELQVDESRQESFERSVMSEANGEALKALQRKIDELQKEKSVLLNENDQLKKDSSLQEVKFFEAETDRVSVADADENGANKSGSEQAWEEERAHLMKQLEQMNTLGEQLLSKDSEIEVLKQEVEAQWANTESFNEKLETARKEKEAADHEKDQLQIEVAGLEARINEMEIDWTESENRKAELENELAEMWTAKEEAERERDQLRLDLARGGPQLEDSRQEIESLESQMKSLSEERDFASENVTRLERLVSERDAELASYSQKLVSKDHEIDDLQDELSSLRRDHSRLKTDISRARDEIEAREADVQRQLTEAMQAKAEAQLEASSVKESTEKLQEDVEKLRRQLHEARQRSADLDVKMLQMERQHELDTEDKIGLNIALDSKQQELELIKRKMGVRGTGGATPAVSTRVNRRDSMAFKTPVPMRPGSALSDIGARPSSALSDFSVKDKPAQRPVLASRTNLNPLPPSTVKKYRLSDASLTATIARKPRPSAPTPLSNAAIKPLRTGTNAVNARLTAASRPRPMSMSINNKSSFLQSSTASETSSIATDDKENATPRPKPLARRMSMQPIPA